MTEDSRYPYTYACDLIRIIAGYGPNGTKLSRADASSIRSTFSSVLGIDDGHVARMLADHYKAHEEEYSLRATKEFQSAQESAYDY